MIGLSRPEGASRTALLAVACFIGAVALSLAATGSGLLPGDVTVSRTIQDLRLSYFDHIERFGYYTGGYQGCIVAGGTAIGLLAMRRYWSETAVIAGALLVRGVNPWLKELLDSPRPTADLVHVAANATANPSTMGFPSGHMMGSVLLYGGLIYVAQVRIASRRARILVQAASITMITIIGLSRIYSGAHWPSDVFGGALWGSFLLLAVILAVRTFPSRRHGRVTIRDDEFR